MSLLILKGVRHEDLELRLKASKQSLGWLVLKKPE